MSNEQMIRIPSSLAESAVDAFSSIGMHDQLEALNAILEQPTEQQDQLACAKLKVRELQSGRLVVEVAAFDAGQLSQRGIVSVFTHADPAEVERLRVERDTLIRALETADSEVNTLRAQLAEAHALLRESYELLAYPQHHVRKEYIELYQRIDATLSNNAPVCCVPTAEEEALLASGDYRPEELWGGSRPTCPKCINKPPQK